MNSRRPEIDWPRVLLQACRRIETAETSLRLSELAEGLGVGATELQRQFTRRLGISPKAYAQALKLHRLARNASSAGNALDAIYDAGFRWVKRFPIRMSPRNWDAKARRAWSLPLAPATRLPC